MQDLASPGYWYTRDTAAAVEVLNALRDYRASEAAMRRRTRSSMGMGETDDDVVEMAQLHRAMCEADPAAERLAVIASITLPITALSSVMGMNVIVNSASDPVIITILLTIMATMSTLLLVWSKRRGWW